MAVLEIEIVKTKKGVRMLIFSRGI